MGTKKGTRFAVLISTAVILGIVFIYLTVSAINQYAFDKITRLHAKTLLTHNLNATQNQIQNYIHTTTTTIESLQTLVQSNRNPDTSLDTYQEILFAELLNLPQAAGVMIATPKGEFLFIQHETKTAPAPDASDTKTIQLLAVKKIRYTPERKVSLDYYDAVTLKPVTELAKADIQNDPYDPRQRPWYKNALQRNDVSWSDPYIFFSSRKPGVTVSAPVYRADTLTAVVGIDLRLDSLNTFVRKLNQQTQTNAGDGNITDWEKSQAMICLEPAEADGSTSCTVIAHTHEQVVDTTNTNAQEKPSLLTTGSLKESTMGLALSSFLRQKSDSHADEIQAGNNGRYYYMFQRTGEDSHAPRLIVGFILPSAAIAGQITSFASTIHSIFLAMGILCLGIGLYAARLFANPINRLSDLAEQISKFDFSTPPSDESTPFMELNTALRTFTAMWYSIKEYQEKNTELSERLKQSYRETILRLASAAEYKDKDTHGHLQRISEYSVLLARQMGLTEEEVERIRFASPMHDIGKIGIPDAILTKPGRYEPEEFAIMQNHSQYGFDMLQPPESPIMHLSSSIALNHHEKYNGKGYPNGLVGDEIPIEAQIVAVADVYDALRSKRCYKDAMPHEKVKKIFEEERGEHFNPQLIDAFFAIEKQFEVISQASAEPDPDPAEETKAVSV